MTRTPTVEVAHEAVLTQWDRLHTWIEEHREDLLLHRRLSEAVEEWEDAQRNPEYLPREGRLTQFETWADATDIALTAGEREFLAEARVSADETAGKRARRRRATLAGFAAFAAASLLLAGFALVLRSRARDDARVATARQLAGFAEGNLNVDPERSILLGIQAAETTRRHDGSILPEAVQALHDALTYSRVLARSPGVGRRPESGIGHVVALAPDALTFAAADLGRGTVSIRDAHTGKKLATLPGHSAEVLAVAYSPDRKFIAAGSADGALSVWSASSRRLAYVIPAHRRAVFAVRFSADGSRLATLGGDRAVRVWDVRSGRLLKSLPGVHERTKVDVAWGEGVAFVGADRIAVAPWSRGTKPSSVVAKVFDISSGKQVSVVRDPAGQTQTLDIDVSRDGKLLAAGHGQGLLQLYRLSDGRQLDVALGSNASGVLDVEFSRDGTLLATGGVDGVAKVWQVANDKLHEMLRLRGHDSPVGSVSFSRAGSRLASWGQLSGEARIWDVSPAGRGEVLALPGPRSAPEYRPDVTFTPDGRRLVASSGAAGTVRVWSVPTGKELFRLDQGAVDRSPLHATQGVDVSPDGSRIATAGADGSVRIFDAETGRQLFALRHQHCVPHGPCVVNRAIFSPDGSMIATTGWDATIAIFDVHTRRLLHVLRGHKPGGFGTVVVEWSGDGRRLLSTGHDGTFIWDPRTGRRLLKLPGGGGPGTSGAWSPDDKDVLTESGLGPPVWDASTGKRLRVLATGAPVTKLVFSRAGDTLAIATRDESSSIRIWDWSSGVEALKLPQGGVALAFSPDGKLLASVQPEPVPFVHVWTLDPERLLQIARHRVTRSLTEDECRRYLHHSCSAGG